MFTKNYYKYRATCIDGYGTDHKSTVAMSWVDTSGTTRTYMVPNVSYGYYNDFGYATICNASGTSRILLGDGTTAPTLDDYCLSGNILTTVSQLSEAVAIDIRDDGITTTKIFVVQNTGDTAITVNEIGWFGYLSYSTNYSGSSLLFERTVLANPVTIEAGKTAQINYEIYHPYT